MSTTLPSVTTTISRADTATVVDAPHLGHQSSHLSSCIRLPNSNLFLRNLTLNSTSTSHPHLGKPTQTSCGKPTNNCPQILIQQTFPQLYLSERMTTSLPKRTTLMTTVTILMDGAATMSRPKVRGMPHRQRIATHTISEPSLTRHHVEPLVQYRESRQDNSNRPAALNRKIHQSLTARSHHRPVGRK